MTLLHASAVSLPVGAVLLTGASGSGKSSLAGFLLETQNGRLVGDDRVMLSAEDGQLMAEAAPPLRGLLEMRGLGVVRLPAAKQLDRAAIKLVVELVPRAQVPRVAAPSHIELVGINVPVLALHAFDHATPMVIANALTHLPKDGFSETGIYPPE